MADFRELIMLNPGLLETGPETRLTRRLVDLKMAARRAVVRSARRPWLRRLYLAIYRVHWWAVVQVAKRFRETDAVYLTAGAGAGDIHIGVSDIEVAVLGHWPEALQFRLMKLLGALFVLTPLLDRNSISLVTTLEDLRNLCATDMYFALTVAVGQRQWRLLYGEDVVRSLPAMAPERFVGSVYLTVRRWWSMIAISALGDDVTARDAVFRNSVCFKTVAEMLRAEHMLDGVLDTERRGALVQAVYARTQDPTVGAVLRLAAGGFLETEQDLRARVLAWTLQRAEAFHREMRATASFASFVPFRVEGTASERSVASRTQAHAEALVTLARAEWPGLEAAWLVPALAMMAPDSLALILKPAAGQMPGVAALRAVRARHLQEEKALPQRMALFMLLDEAAYQIDTDSLIELAHYTLTPETAPEVFAALAEPEFLLFGTAEPPRSDLRWSGFAQEFAVEEMTGRRGAYGRFGVTSRPGDLENLRNFWRYAQLLVMARTASEGEILLPRTIAATHRALLRWMPERAEALRELEEAHRQELASPGPSARRYDALLERTQETLVAALG